MKSNRTPYLLSTLIISLLLCVLNWKYAYREVLRQSQQVAVAEFVDMPLPELSPTTVSMGGWPVKYVVELSSPDLPVVQSFSLTNLLVDIVIGLVILGVVLAFQRHVVRRKQREPGTKRSRISLLDLLIATASIALLVAYLRALESQAQKEVQLVKRIADRGGQAVETLSLVWPLDQLLPATTQANLRRVTEVTLHNPDSEVMQQVLALPYLTKLMVGGGEYDLKLLEQLQSKPLLTHLRLSGRKLDQATLQTIVNLRQLQSLSLVRTNVTDQFLPALANLPRLQALNVIHTNVELNTADAPFIAKTIRVLALGHPPAGRTATSTIDNWPTLERLICAEYDEPINKTAMELVVANVPQLKQIALDRMQNFNLTITGAPKLSELVRLDWQANQRVPASSPIAPGMALGIVKLMDTPNLSRLDCAISYLEELHLSQVDNLTVDVMGMDSSVGMMGGGWMRNNSGAMGTAGSGSAQKLEDSKLTRIVSALASDSGPNRVGFTNVSLRNVDIRPLLASKRIRQLDLSNCGLIGEQIRRVTAPDSAIEELNLKDNWDIDSDGITSIVRALPKLRVLQCDTLRLMQLSLSNNDRLERLFDSDASVYALLDVRLANMPLLREELKLPDQLYQLQLKNMPSLTGISTRGPWPTGAKISGLRDLKYFTGGGARLDDSIFNELLACKNLESLILIDTSISTSSLSQIDQWKSLKHLALSGKQIDSSVVDKVCTIQSLESLSLDDVAISEDQLTAISRMSNLQRLSLKNVALSVQAFSKLAGLSRLTSLTCGGAHITSEHLQSLQSLTNLVVLDLSNSKLNRQALDRVREIPGITKIVLKDCELDNAGIVAIARDRNWLMETGDSDLEIEAMQTLQNTGRLITFEPEMDDLQAVFMQRMGGYGGPEDELSTRLRTVAEVHQGWPGYVHPDRFRPTSEQTSPWDGQTAGGEPMVSSDQSSDTPPAVYQPMTFSESIGYYLGLAAAGWAAANSDTIEQ